MGQLLSKIERLSAAPSEIDDFVPESSSGGFVQESKAVRSKKLTSYLKDIESNLKLDKEETRGNVEIMGRVLEFLLKQMAIVDETFKFLYRDIFYTGSYYDGLRITSASEFDLNIILAFPFKPAHREVQEDNDFPAFAKYHLQAPAKELMEKMYNKPPARLADFFDDENYLLPNKIRFWLQSVLDLAWAKRREEIDQFLQRSKLQKIEIKESGPARTLLIMTLDEKKIDVDLVPVIVFRYPEWPNGAKKYVKLDSNNVWFLVPKALAEYDPRLWRLNFPIVERELLRDLGYVKPLIKFLKKLRDNNNWKNLASYYLKTFVMWEIQDSEDEKWSGDMGELFLELLRKLSHKVRNRRLPYLFYPEYNLLHSMSQDEAVNISNRINIIIYDIERFPETVLHHLA